MFVLSLLVGFEVISKVPATLHTPLMSGANADPRHRDGRRHAAGATVHTALGYVLAFAAVAFAAMNVVGGYVVTDRMLEMFRAASRSGSATPRPERPS